ncbi:hypothetical protein F0L68_27035 [Solihabitans fulvus]|uniref:Uncharacterized protein n=1 Tax=Solihabitans fulvus TaxID=1892852 RepID=A0A5B2WZD5_9PSEU|nr:hypothetical protein [Solihabitans fulvus]KAA2256102.1 hypothetical protein F0L68_27035 [Solihabitans fulvus]
MPDQENTGPAGQSQPEQAAAQPTAPAAQPTVPAGEPSTVPATEPVAEPAAQPAAAQPIGEPVTETAHAAAAPPPQPTPPGAVPPGYVPAGYVPAPPPGRTRRFFRHRTTHLVGAALVGAIIGGGVIGVVAHHDNEGRPGFHYQMRGNHRGQLPPGQNGPMPGQPGQQRGWDNGPQHG